MKRLLLLFVFCWATSVAAQTPGGQTINGTTVVMPPACKKVHQDKAVNNAVTVVVPPPPSTSQTTYICGWDWQVVQNGTGTAQTNVLWTTTNFGGVAQEYSISATPNALVSDASYFNFAVVADAANLPITLVSPAAAANIAYSANVYYFYGPIVP